MTKKQNECYLAIRIPVELKKALRVLSAQRFISLQSLTIEMIEGFLQINKKE